MASAVTPALATSQARNLRLIQTTGYFIAFIALGVSMASMGPSLSSLAAHTGSTLAQVSVVFTARAFGYMVGSLVGGRLYDRLNGNPIIGLSFLIMAAMLAFTPVITQLWLLSLVLVLLSVADGIIDVGCNTLLVWAHRESSTLGPFMNALHFFFGIGAFATPILAAQVLATTGDVHWLFWILAGLVLIPAVMNLRIASPAHPSHINITPSPSASQQTRPPENMRLVLLMAVFFFAIVGLEAICAGWIASYALATGFGNEAEAAVVASVFWGGFTLARLLSIPLATRMPARAMLWINVIGCGLFAVLMITFTPAAFALWVGAFGLGFCVAPLFPTMISFAESRMAITGKVTSIFLAGSSIGGMTLPWLVGQMFVPVGPQSLLWMALAATAITALILLVAQRLTRHSA